MNSQKVGNDSDPSQDAFNRAGEPSVTFCGKEEQRREHAQIFEKIGASDTKLLRRGSFELNGTNKMCLKTKISYFFLNIVLILLTKLNLSNLCENAIGKALVSSSM